MSRLRSFKRGAVTIMGLDDPLMEGVAETLKQNAEEMLSGGNLQLVVDLGSVPYIDSMGLEVLLDLNAKAGEMGGVFCLASPNELCRDILRATRLDNIIVVYPTLDEACRSFI